MIRLESLLKEFFFFRHPLSHTHTHTPVQRCDRFAVHLIWNYLIRRFMRSIYRVHPARVGCCRRNGGSAMRTTRNRFPSRSSKNNILALSPNIKWDMLAHGEGWRKALTKNIPSSRTRSWAAVCWKKDGIQFSTSYPFRWCLLFLLV